MQQTFVYVFQYGMVMNETGARNETKCAAGLIESKVQWTFFNRVKRKMLKDVLVEDDEKNTMLKISEIIRRLSQKLKLDKYRFFWTNGTKRYVSEVRNILRGMGVEDAEMLESMKLGIDMETKVDTELDRIMGGHSDVFNEGNKGLPVIEQMSSLKEERLLWPLLFSEETVEVRGLKIKSLMQIAKETNNEKLSEELNTNMGYLEEYQKKCSIEYAQGIETYHYVALFRRFGKEPGKNSKAEAEELRKKGLDYHLSVRRQDAA